MRPILFFLLLMIAYTGIAQQTTTERIHHFNLENGIGIQGYDPVAYFLSEKAVKGKKTITASYLGVVYRFSSEKNKSLFLSDPARYEPQYGGWCAFAMGDYGKKVEINPETFNISEGKLYLFYNAYFNNTLKSWKKDENRLKQQADKNWLKLIQ